MNFDVLLPLQSTWSEQDNLCMLLYVTYFIIYCFIWKVMHVFIQPHVVTSQKLTVTAKNTLILPKNSLKLISSKFSRFWLPTYLLVVFFTDSRNSYVHQLCSHFANLFLGSYEEDIKKKTIEASPIFNLTFRCIGCYFASIIMSLKQRCHWYIYVCIIPCYLHLEIDSVSQLRMKLYDKRDDFKITIVNFPFQCNNIKATPTFGVFISQLIQYSRTCQWYRDFLHIW